MNIDQGESSKVEKPCTMRCQQGFNEIGMPTTMHRTLKISSKHKELPSGLVGQENYKYFI
jgi:hypothetical protein